MSRIVNHLRLNRTLRLFISRKISNIHYTDLNIPYDPNVDTICRHAKIPYYSSFPTPKYTMLYDPMPYLIGFLIFNIWFYNYCRYSEKKLNTTFYKNVDTIIQAAFDRLCDFFIHLDSLYYPIDRKKAEEYDKQFPILKNYIDPLYNERYDIEFNHRTYSADFANFRY